MSTIERPQVGPFTLPDFPRPVVGRVGACNVELFPHAGSTMSSVAVLLPAAGYLNEPPERRGLHELTLRIACEAADGMDSSEFQQRVDSLGAQFAAGVDATAGAVWLRVPTENLDAGIELLAAVLRRASLDEETFIRSLRFAAEDAMMRKEMPDRAAALALDEYYFAQSPAHERLRYPSSGEASDLQQTSQGDVLEAYAECAQPQGSTIVAVGDFDVAHLSATLEQYFGDWTPGDQRAPQAPLPNPEPVPTLVLIPRQEAVQSSIAVAIPAVGKTDPRYAAVVCKAHVVLTGAESQLNERMRTQGGYTYGCHGQIDATAVSGRLVISTAVDGPSTAQAVRDLVDVAFEPTPMTEIQCREAVNELVASRAGDTASAQPLAQRVVMSIAGGLPSTFRDDLIGRLRSLTAEKVDAAWRDAVRVEQAVMAVVGQPEVLAELADSLPEGYQVVQVQDEFNEGMENDMGDIPYVNGAEEFNAAINEELPVLVDFTASWCGPCKSLAPILDDLAANEWADQLRVVKVDADANPEICEKYGVLGLPTLILFEEGEQLMASTGAMNKAQLIKAFDPFL